MPNQSLARKQVDANAARQLLNPNMHIAKSIQNRVKTCIIFVVGAVALSLSAAAADKPYIVHSTDGKCVISIDTSEAPDLKEWARTKLAQALSEWYPKIVAMLASDGFTAPTNVTVKICPGSGVAGTSGNHIEANATWIKEEIGREATGSLIHEMVHIVQQYGDVEKPGWLTEGIADYIRWFLYEPQSHGADDVWMQQTGQKNNFSSLHYDDSYRVSANFLNYVATKHDKNIVTKINAAIREDRYTEDLWKQYTGKTLKELGAEWKENLAKKLGVH